MEPLPCFDQGILHQIIGADGGSVLASASTVQKAVGEGLKGTGNVDAAKAVGKALAERAKAAGAKGWLGKPFKPDMLLATVEKLAA